MTDEDRFDVDALLALPRLSGLALSPDGSRLVVAVARSGEEGKKLVTALWELDPDGETEPRRLTRSAPGESGAAFLPDGSLLFTSSRPDPDAGPDDPRGEAPALWRLPAGGGEASLLAAPPAGVDAVAAARDSGRVVFAAGSHAGSESWEVDAEREKARKDAGVTARLYTDYPIRYWDRYLGPRERHLLAADLPAGDAAVSDPTDVIPSPGRSLDLVDFDVTPDGGTVVTGRRRDGDDLRERPFDLVAVDVATSEQRMLAADGGDYGSIACSPDGRWVACIRDSPSGPDAPLSRRLWVFDLGSGEGREIAASLDLWPLAPVWAPDSSAVLFTADRDGRTSPFRVELDSDRVTRLASEGDYTDLCPSPDGRTVYALRETVAEPPRPVALDATAADADPRPLRGWDPPPLPARLERVTATAGDGAEVPSWLLLPPDASADSPAPLAVLIHGGPLASWNGWHWRWNPHVFTDAGYAVLLPDPALSTGYGQAAIDRGWGRWGDVVYGDVMAAVDAAVERPEIDQTRTAALGGSFGGYMANWIAGHTDRFEAIVTHASLWSLDAFHGTTDLGVWWEREFGDPYTAPERYREHSPNLHVAEIRTPMLVVHGEQDYRVPIGEALTLWTDLRRHGVDAKFLYFPDENHWVLKPNNSRVWYATVLAFLDEHVRGAAWAQPELL